jgi:hypothetical protein
MGTKPCGGDRLAHHGFQPAESNNARKPASSRTATPRASALASFEPGRRRPLGQRERGRLADVADTRDAYRKWRGSVVRLAAAMRRNRGSFCADFSPMRSRPRAARRRARTNPPACAPSPASTSCSTSLSPRPWMSSARREAKCLISSLRCAAQRRPPAAARRRLGRRRAPPASRRPGRRWQLDAARIRRPRSGSPRTTSGITSPGAPDHHRVADAHVLARQFVHVVQGGVADRDAADEGRLQARHRRQRAGATDLKLDVAHRGQRFLRGKLVRDRPARRARDEAELACCIEVVDLVDHAVDLIGQLRARRPCRGSTRGSRRWIRPRA